MANVKIIVTLKPTLLDAQGRVVQNALHSLGYSNVEQVRIGKYMELAVSFSESENLLQREKKVKEMCDRLLANPVIEDYEFRIEEEEK